MYKNKRKCPANAADKVHSAGKQNREKSTRFSMYVMKKTIRERKINDKCQTIIIILSGHTLSMIWGT